MRERLAHSRDFSPCQREVADELGIRGSFEDRIFRRARIGPRLVWARRDGGVQ